MISMNVEMFGENTHSLESADNMKYKIAHRSIQSKVH